MKKSTSKLMILITYIVLILSSGYILFQTYMQNNIINVVISSITLILSLFLFRREYIFKDEKINKRVEKEDKKALVVEKPIQKPIEDKTDKPTQQVSNTNEIPIFDNLKALIIEDNPINRKLIQYTLTNIGIVSDTAENGKIGVELRIKNKYDVILMDIQMPVMNGVEATKAILEYEAKHNLKHVPIIAITANALKGDRERFLEAGMDEYISKPIDLHKFLDVLKRFFSDKQVDSSNNKDILLYKQTSTEAKIIGAILKKLGYTVDITDDIEEFKKVMDINSYNSILLDRVQSDSIHENVTQKIKSKNIPSLLFVDHNSNIVSSDKESYTHVADKLTDFQQLKNKVDSMMEA